jgi:hypothetical protein
MLRGRPAGVHRMRAIERAEIDGECRANSGGVGHEAAGICGFA